MAAAPPAPQQPLVLQLREGHIQACGGRLHRRTKFLKRWKKEWITVDPGEFIAAIRSKFTVIVYVVRSHNCYDLAAGRAILINRAFAWEVAHVKCPCKLMTFCSDGGIDKEMGT